MGGDSRGGKKITAAKVLRSARYAIGFCSSVGGGRRSGREVEG